MDVGKTDIFENVFVFPCLLFSVPLNEVKGIATSSGCGLGVGHLSIRTERKNRSKSVHPLGNNRCITSGFMV